MKRQVSPSTPPAASANVAPTAFAPPPHSIAVLPFVNMSGDPEQEYFSDGLTEELLNSLSPRSTSCRSRPAPLRSPSRAKDTDIGTIARKLNVGAVLEGSVRRSAHTIRITAQLINAVTGFHLWSETYDRDLGDVLKLQTEIATAVASALKVTLLGDVAAKVELGGTRNPDRVRCVSARVKGLQLEPRRQRRSHRDCRVHGGDSAGPELCARVRGPIAGAFGNYAGQAATGAAIAGDLRQGAGGCAAGTHARAGSGRGSSGAGRLFRERTRSTSRGRMTNTSAPLALAPGNAQVLRRRRRFVVYMGHADAAIAAVRRVVVLDPLNRGSHFVPGPCRSSARRIRRRSRLSRRVSSRPGRSRRSRGSAGSPITRSVISQSARASCETKPDDWGDQVCLAMIYDKLGRHADAEADACEDESSTSAMPRRTSTPRSMRSGAIGPRRSNGSRRRCACVIRAWRT